MPCFIGCLALSMPRLAIVFVVIFSDFIGRAYDTVLWPLLGFVFMPLTTLVYAWAINSRGELAGIQLAIFIIALCVDFGLVGRSASKGSHVYKCRS